MPRTLFISDLDGTLLGPDSKVSERSARMLGEAIARGTLFSVATARTPSTVSALMAGVETRLPYVVMTGAAVWDKNTGLYSRVVTMDAPTAGAVWSAICRRGLPAFVYTLKDNVIDIYHNGPLSDLERRFMAERQDSPYKIFHVPEDGCSLVPDPLEDVVLFYSMHPSDAVARTYADVRQIPGINPLCYNDLFGPETGILEVFSADASKARAVEWLKGHAGADRVVAFGDNINDIPMLRAADVAVAVGNAVPEVKEVADIVIGPNSEDSVARFILEHDGNI